MYIIECVDEELNTISEFFLSDIQSAIFLSHDIAYTEYAYKRAGRPSMVIVNQLGMELFDGDREDSWVYASITGEDDMIPLAYYTDIEKNIKYGNKTLFKNED